MDTLPPVSPPPLAISGEDKTAAILSYITIFGFIAAVILHGNNKTRLGAFHMRQSLGIYLTATAATLIAMIPFIGWLVALVVWAASVVLWIMGFIAAASGKTTPVPLFGEHYQRWFGTAFD